MTHKSNNSPVSKAVQKSVFLGITSITAYMLPDGTYTLASSNITKAIHKRRFSLSEFLASKSIEALSCKGFSLSETSEIPTENSVADIKPVPLYVAIAYWNYWNRRGNQYACTLIEALANGHMMTLLDDAFGVQRDEKERSEALAQMLHPDPEVKIQQARASMSARHLELESELTGELLQKVAQIEQLNKIHQDLTFQNKALSSEKEKLIGEVFVEKEKERKIDTLYDSARWAINMKQLGDRKIELLEKQVEQLTSELNAQRAKIDVCHQTIIRNAQAMAEQILADKQRKASETNEQ